MIGSGAWWYIPVIPAAWESPGKGSWDPFSKIKYKQKGGSLAQLTEHLPGMFQAPAFNPPSCKKTKQNVRIWLALTFPVLWFSPEGHGVCQPSPRCDKWNTELSHTVPWHSISRCLQVLFWYLWYIPLLKICFMDLGKKRMRKPSK
jgi:hypothetical protein